MGVFDSSQVFKTLINKLDSQKIKDYKFSFEHIEEWIEKSVGNYSSVEIIRNYFGAIDEYPANKSIINKSLGWTVKKCNNTTSSFDYVIYKSDYLSN